MKHSLLGVMLVAVFALTGCGQPKDPIVVEDGWVRALPPGAKMTAGYVSITNNGDGELRMLGASSPNFGRIEMHSVYLEDGVQQMRMVDGYKIAPGETLTLSSGAEHLMMRFPRDLEQANGEVPVSLAFRGADGELLSIETRFALRQSAP
ncbi:MAG: copper chaperone PCu(A)C [Abyssibacter sp.]|uniref:copper chaperone PCu(A)C n=1 Tax=Abyssibacter sp. TaxID=2320200 RepID=UPI00321B4592